MQFHLWIMFLLLYQYVVVLLFLCPLNCLYFSCSFLFSFVIIFFNVTLFKKCKFINMFFKYICCYFLKIIYDIHIFAFENVSTSIQHNSIVHFSYDYSWFLITLIFVINHINPLTAIYILMCSTSRSQKIDNWYFIKI